MKIVHVPMQDDETTDLSPHWEAIFKEIDDARKSAGRALLLCAMGISRSATFAIGYVMTQEKRSLHDAYKVVQMGRNIVCPNVSFFQQLIDLEVKTRGSSSVTIIEPIPGVKVADVVWNELYEEMLQSMSEADRHSIASLNFSTRSSNDVTSLRSLNIIDEMRATTTSLASFRLSDIPSMGASPTLLVPPHGSSARGSAPLQRARTEPPVNNPVLPKSALRDKSKPNEKKKKWRLSFSKDVT
ncbi:unnamed protein product [Caenorhabditis auriculariae]|uniref:Tyrosine-protein phosphatase domain-containing protein n=1 Tax=Caenorhabditis auriculariae TaxID=2777116 RepID=A0A8S1GYQ0_9PELO|nr:unnamed protein product [Caenorhabditis auriculariae]